MAGLTGIKLHTALFFDLRGEYIGSKLIKASSKWGIKKKTFTYGTGTYNINCNASRSRTIYFPWLFDHLTYYYTIGNSDPLYIKHNIAPLMRADDYNVQLESKVLRDLNKVRQGGLAALLTPKNIIILLIIIAIVYYFSSGGSLNAPQ